MNRKNAIVFNHKTYVGTGCCTCGKKERYTKTNKCTNCSNTRSSKPKRPKFNKRSVGKEIGGAVKAQCEKCHRIYYDGEWMFEGCTITLPHVKQVVCGGCKNER